MPRAVWLAMLLCLGCAGARPTTEPAPAIDAMLLPPVDGQLALWVNHPANFAVIGVAQDQGADVLYQQTALQGVPTSGYVYVPRGDAGYDRVYLIASRDPIDLSGSLDDAMSGANVVDAYAADTVRADSLRCWDGRLTLVRTEVIDKLPPRKRVLTDHFGECLQHRSERRGRYLIAAGRAFLVLPRPRPAHKSLPPGYKPPKLVPKPGTKLERGDERALRWYAAKDQWHAITHNGEPGTELPRALGYVQYGSAWVPRSGNTLLISAHDQVRAIVNGSVGAVRGTAPTYSSGYHESATRATYSAPSYSSPSYSAPSHESSAGVSRAGSSGGHH